MTRMHWLLVFLLAMSAPFALAQEETTQEEPAAATAKDIIAEFENASNAWMRQMRAASAEERETLMDKRPDGGTFAARVMAAIAGKEAAAENAEALMFLMQNASDATVKGHGIESLVKHHSGNAELMEQFVRGLGQEAAPAAADALTTLAKSENANIAIPALYGKASRLSYMMEMADGYRGADEAMKKRYVDFFGADTVKAMTALDAAAARKEIATVYEAIVKDERSAGVKMRGQSYAEMAKTQLFEIRNLSVGCKAPEITGPDTDGVTFNLSDYKGKVVFLDFWGHW